MSSEGVFAGWFFAAGMQTSATWSFDGLPEGEGVVVFDDLAPDQKVSLFLEMTLVGEVELVHYAPWLATTQAHLRAVIDGDVGGVVSGLTRFLESAILGKVLRVTEFRMETEDVDRTLVALMGHMRSAIANGFASFSPTHPGTLVLSPSIECDGLLGVLTLKPHVSHLSRHFSAGMDIVICSPGEGRRTVRLSSVHDGRVSIEDRYDVTDGPWFITGVVADDPMRLVHANEFHLWFAGVSGTSEITDMEFNDALYRVLYTAVDPRLGSLSPTELFADYLSHPTRISSVVDLVSALRDAPDVVRRSLTLSRGATIVFGATGKSIAGITTKADVQLGTDESVDDISVPTTAAVKEMLLDGAQGASTSGIRECTTSGVRVEGGTDGRWHGVVAEYISVADSVSADRRGLRTSALVTDTLESTATRMSTLSCMHGTFDTADVANCNADTMLVGKCDARNIECDSIVVAGRDIASDVEALRRAVAKQ